MRGVNRFVSQLVRAANTANRRSAERVAGMLEEAIKSIRRLRQATNIIPIPGKDAIIYVRTVAAGADRVPREECAMPFSMPRR
jgi:hypothetical protein